MPCFLPLELTVHDSRFTVEGDDNPWECLYWGRDLPSLSWIQGCFLILMCMRNIFKNGVMLIHKLQVSTIINSQSFTFSIILLSEFSSV